MAKEVWVVVTEVNGYRNFWGSFVYAHKEKAEAVRQEVIDGGKYDDVYVVGMFLNEKEA